MNIAHLLERSASVHGHRPALAFGDEIDATYAEFFAGAARLARTLRERWGIGVGDRIGLYCANHRAYLQVMYAAWIAGAVVVPVNSKLHAREAAWILENSAAALCWVEAGHATDLADALGQPMRIESIDDWAAACGDAPWPIEPREADDIAWLFYTSGTTGRPKGVMLSHGNLLQATECFLADVHPVALGDVLLHAAPQSHGSGLYNFAFIARGGVNAVPASRGFDEQEVLSLAQRYPGMSLFAAPTMVKRLVAAEKASPGGAANLGTIVYGGGPMYLADIQEAIACMGQKFAQIYGQGESPMTISALPKSLIADVSHPRYLERLASVGHAQICMRIAIRDAEGRDLRAGEVGEIWVKGPAVMQGYWNNSESTAQALRDGWLCTGDIGLLDGDGFLTLKDRSKDLIISGGTNIYPREVEEALLQHPAVREVSVIGIADAEWGESVLAFVVGEGVDAAELDRFCLERIARFKRPKQYRFVDQLPKNNYGKVLKTALRDLAAQQA